jgi:cytochrome c5
MEFNEMIISNRYTRRTALAALILVTWVVVPTAALSQDYPAPGNATAGAKTWANNCSRCHNMRDPQDLRDDQWITTMFHMRLRAGLTGQQTRDVLTFLQDSNSRNTPAAVNFDAAAAGESGTMTGEEIYNTTCVACHGADGKGQVPGAPNLRSKNGPLSKPDQLLIEHITNGFKSEGSPMAMPPKGGNPSLSARDVRNVLGYMRRTFGGSGDH